MSECHIIQFYTPFSKLVPPDQSLTWYLFINISQNKRYLLLSLIPRWMIKYYFREANQCADSWQGKELANNRILLFLMIP